MTYSLYIQSIFSIMDKLNRFLDLLSKTQSREKCLRVVQYATLYSVDQKVSGPALKIYEQMRMVRKLLRFLRTLQYSTKIREQFPDLKKNLGRTPLFIKSLFSILQNLFTMLFFLADHRVCLGELGVIDRQQATANYPKSMKFYLLQNIFGVLKNIVQICISIWQDKKGEQSQQNTIEKTKKFGFDLIKCLFDCLIALYYIGKRLPANKIGVLGVITSLMGIMQSLGAV